VTTKQELLDYIAKLPDDSRFAYEVRGAIHHHLLTYAPIENGKAVTVLYNEKPLEFAVNHITAAELMLAADKAGYRQSYERILIEEMPNGTSKIIGQREVIHIRDHMKFVAIGV
jgi:predicted metalloenzyme YecM